MMYDQHSLRVARAFACLLCFCGVLTSGCRTGRTEGSRSVSLTVERIPTERGYYRDVEVFEDEAGFHVTGFVKRFIEPGHVHIKLLDAESRVIAEQRVDVHRPLRSSRVRNARFEALFHAFERDPEAVQILYHHSPDDDSAGL